VLKPGGSGLIIDLRGDASPESMNRHVEGLGLNAIDKIMTKLVFRYSLIKTAYTREQFKRMLAQATFRSADIREVDIGFEISMTK
jgi:hypothetical protein